MPLAAPHFFFSGFVSGSRVTKKPLRRVLLLRVVSRGRGKVPAEGVVNR